MQNRNQIERLIYDMQWKKQPIAADSPFRNTVGLGSPCEAYQRSRVPSVVSLLIYVLPELLIGFIFISFGITFGYVLGGLVTLFGLYQLYKIIRAWPDRTPMRIALFTNGIAWIDADGVHQLTWQQIKSTRVKGGYIIEAQDGSQLILEETLMRRAFGQAVEQALQNAQ